MADTPGTLQIGLTLLEGSPRQLCGLRLAVRRPATAADRRRALAEAELARGHALRKTGKPANCRAGIAPYERAERGFADLGLPRRQAEALLGLGRLQRDCLGQSRAALAVFTRAEPLFAVDPAFESEIRQHLGEIRYRLNDLEGAAGDCRRALALRRRLGDRFGEALTSSTLGDVLLSLGRYDEATAFLDRALKLWQPGDDAGKRAQTLVNRGQLYRALGDRERARRQLLQALPLFREAKDGDHEAATWNALGGLAIDAGRPGDALEPLRKALALRTPGSRGMAVTLTSLGVAYRDLGQLEEARQAYTEALPIFYENGDSREEARTIGNMGVLEAASGQEESALAQLDHAFERFRSLSDRPAMALTLLAKARVLHGRGDLEAARSVMETSLAVVEEHRSRQTSLTTRAEFFATRQDLYDFLIDLLMEMDRQAEALEINERSLSRSLLDRLTASGLDLPAGNLSGNSRDAALLQPRTASAAEIQNGLLDRDTLLLEYRLGEERSYLWAVTPDGLSAFALPGRAAIERTARQAVERLARSRIGKSESAARQPLADLSRRLLGPVASLLPGKRLVVVSDGALQSLPFAVLPDPDSPSGDGQPLIAGHEVISLPSVSVLGEIRRDEASRTRAPKTLWVLANPDFGRRFDPLPYTRHEAAEILALVPPRDRAVALGRDASRETVLRGDLRDYRFLHFATHGAFDAEDGSGRLALAQIGPGGRPEADGFLHLTDIYALDLRADLVVLSACQSALGRELRGEGVMGLPRGFLHAGADRVLVSLWNVNDRATAELMRHFYRGILVEGLSPAAALRNAQNAIRQEKRWKSPYYWAGFTLQGEWR